MISGSGLSTYKMTPSSHGLVQKADKSKQNSWADALPGIGGTVGQIGGGILGAGAGVAGGAAIPGADLTGAPEVAGGVMGEKAGQTVGGAGGQMVGDALKQLFQGQGSKMDAGSLLSNAGQGALYAQVPGGKMAADIANPLVRGAAKAGIRAIGGAGVGAGTQGMRNVQKGQPLTQNMGSQAAMSGALNTILPGAAEGLGVLGKGAQWIGNKGAEMGQSVISRKGMAATQAVQKLFGGQTLETGQGGAKISKPVQDLFNKYNYTPPPEGNVQEAAGFLSKASQDVENHLQPILKAEAVTNDDVAPLVKKNLETFYGTANLGSKSKNIPPEIKTYLNKLKGGQMNLSELKTFQRGLKDYGNWSPGTKTSTEKFANNLYRDVGDLIETKLKGAKLPKGWDANAYKELQQRHQTLTKMRDNFQPYQEGKQLPTEVLSKEMGQQKMLGGLLSNERAMQIALTAGAPVATQMIPGLPHKDLFSAIELALLAPAAIPEAGAVVGKGFEGAGQAMQKPSQSKNVMNILSQLGVRLPSAGQ